MDHISADIHTMPEKMNAVDDDACMLAWQLTTASVIPMTLKAALELDLLEILVSNCGDMLNNVPTGDAILIKYTLHDWSDKQCVTILKNCYKALPDNGKVIIVERILPINPEATPESQGVFDVDLVMLLQTPGGKERTQKEFEAMATEAGFTS